MEYEGEAWEWGAAGIDMTTHWVWQWGMGLKRLLQLTVHGVWRCSSYREGASSAWIACGSGMGLGGQLELTAHGVWSSSYGEGALSVWRACGCSMGMRGRGGAARIDCSWSVILQHGLKGLAQGVWGLEMKLKQDRPDLLLSPQCGIHSR